MNDDDFIPTRRSLLKLHQASSLAAPEPMPAGDSESGTRTGTVERVADPNAFNLEAVWDAEWQRNRWDVALARVKAQVKPKQFQMFDLYALKEWPPKDVARALGVSVAHVYVNKDRIAALLKKALHALASEPGGG